MVKRALLVVAVAACTGNQDFVVQPVIDVPVNDSGSPYPIDSLTLSVAHEGADIDLVSTTFLRGSTVTLSDIPFADDLVMHMVGRYKGSDVAYGRTCRFELRVDARIPVPHLFLARNVKFGALSTQPLARADGVAITYTDGSGILVGGHVPDNPTEGLTQVERFDPNTGTYATLHDVARRIGAAVALVGDAADSRVVVLGGYDPSTGIGAHFIELIDADRTQDHQYDMFQDSSMPLLGMSATSLTDGRVIAIGGKDPAQDAIPVDQVIEVSLESGTPIARPLRAKLAYPRYLHSATRLGDQIGSPVLVTGGLDKDGKPVAQAELFKPLAEDFVATFQPVMNHPRWRHQAVRLPDGSVLIIGGIDAMGNKVTALELFSLDRGFVDLSAPPIGVSLPDNAGAIDFTATTLPDGRVLITGGRQFVDGPPVNSAYIVSLDTFDGTVDIVPTDRLSVARAGHQATLLCDGTVLIAGGTPDSTQYERYNPTPAGRR